MNKKKLFLWSLYDFANSFVFINFVLYFAQWIVLDGGLSDFWYNALFAIATILLFFSAPILAAYTDNHGGRKLFLNYSTVGTFIFYGLSAICAYTGTGNIFLVAIFFLLGQYFYQLSFSFYNPMINEVSDEAHRSRASGIGQFSNALGQAAGLVVTLPFSDSKTIPLLIAVGAFFILALPMMIWFKESRIREYGISFKQIKSEALIYKKKLMIFFAVSAATPMLVSYFFFNDALITAVNNYSLYMQRVFPTPDSTKSLIMISIIAMAAMGGIFAGWLGDRVGSFKMMKIILIGWIIALPIVAVAPSLTVFIIVTLVVGLLIGAMNAITRSYMSSILKDHELAYGFSFFSLFERFSTLVGPLVWGGTIAILGTEALSFRIAMGIMTIFVIIGLIVLVKWRRTALVVNV